MLVQMFPAVLAITADLLAARPHPRRVPDVRPRVASGALLLVYLGGALGVNTFLMKGYFDTIPVDIDESARIDGAGHVRIFFGLILRLSLPILVVVFFVSFQAHVQRAADRPGRAARHSRTPRSPSASTALVSNPLIQEWGLMAAGGVMTAIPLFALFLITSSRWSPA